MATGIGDRNVVEAIVSGALHDLQSTLTFAKAKELDRDLALLLTKPSKEKVEYHDQIRNLQESFSGILKECDAIQRRINAEREAQQYRNSEHEHILSELSALPNPARNVANALTGESWVARAGPVASAKVVGAPDPSRGPLSYYNDPSNLELSAKWLRENWQKLGQDHKRICELNEQLIRVHNEIEAEISSL